MESIHNKFKGRISKIGKDGHIGVVLKSKLPIIKDKKHKINSTQVFSQDSFNLRKKRNKSFVGVTAKVREKLFAPKRSLVNEDKHFPSPQKKDINLTPNISTKFRRGSLIKIKERKDEPLLKMKSQRKQRISLQNIAKPKQTSSRKRDGPYSKMITNIKMLHPLNKSESASNTAKTEISSDYKYKVNMLKIREEARKETVQSGRTLKMKMKNYNHPLNTTNHTDYNSNNICRQRSPVSYNGESMPEYFVNDYSNYQVTYDNNSTTVTEGGSGFSLTETVGTINPLMRRSHSHTNTRRKHVSKEKDVFERIIKKFKFAMHSPIHSSHSNFRHLEDIVNM